MPQVSAVKVGEIIPVRCCCGAENHPMPFIPGCYEVECQHRNIGYGWGPKRMIVKMSIGSEGKPEVNTYWRGG